MPPPAKEDLAEIALEPLVEKDPEHECGYPESREPLLQPHYRCDDQEYRGSPLAWLSVHRAPAQVHRLALAAVVPVRIRLPAEDTAVLDRLPIDRDEDDGSRLRRAMHPDRRSHGSRAGVDALPHA